MMDQVGTAERRDTFAVHQAVKKISGGLCDEYGQVTVTRVEAKVITTGVPLMA